MNITEALKVILKNEHMSQTELSNQMGYSSVSSLNTLFRNKNITIKKLIEICDILDYEITLKPKNGIDKVSRTVRIDEK